MNKKNMGWLYAALSVLIVVVDQLTKRWALGHAQDGYPLTSFLSFDLAFNRGISWGMLHDFGAAGFIVVTSLIVGVTVLVAWYAYQRFCEGHTIIGELLVVAGSCSNIIDRIMYGGVVDFIHFFYGNYSWPLFNVADMSIVIGVFFMLWYNYTEE